MQKRIALNTGHGAIPEMTDGLNGMTIEMNDKCRMNRFPGDPHEPKPV